MLVRGCVPHMCELLKHPWKLTLNVWIDHDKREQEWDRKTYIALKEFAKQHPDLVEVGLTPRPAVRLATR